MATSQEDKAVIYLLGNQSTKVKKKMCGKKKSASSDDKTCDVCGEEHGTKRVLLKEPEIINHASKTTPPEQKTNAVMTMVEVKRLHEFGYLEIVGNLLPIIIVDKDKFEPKTSQISTSAVNSIRYVFEPFKQHEIKESRKLIISYFSVTLTESKNPIEDLSTLLLIQYSYRYNTLLTILFNKAWDFVTGTFTIQFTNKSFLMETVLKYLLQKTENLKIACQHLVVEESGAEIYLKSPIAVLAKYFGCILQKSHTFLKSCLLNVEVARTQQTPQIISLSQESSLLENVCLSLKLCEKEEEKNAFDTPRSYMDNYLFHNSKTTLMCDPKSINNSSTFTIEKVRHLDDEKAENRNRSEFTIKVENASLMSTHEISSYWDSAVAFLLQQNLKRYFTSIRIESYAHVWLPLLYDDMLYGPLSGTRVDSIECNMTFKKKHLMPLLLELTEEKKFDNIVLSLEEVDASEILNTSYLCSQCCKWMNCNEIIERQLDDLQKTAYQSGIKLTVHHTKLPGDIYTF